MLVCWWKTTTKTIKYCTQIGSHIWHFYFSFLRIFFCCCRLFVCVCRKHTKHRIRICELWMVNSSANWHERKFWIGYRNTKKAVPKIIIFIRNVHRMRHTLRSQPPSICMYMYLLGRAKKLCHFDWYRSSNHCLCSYDCTPYKWIKKKGNFGAFNDISHFMNNPIFGKYVRFSINPISEFIRKCYFWWNCWKHPHLFTFRSACVSLCVCVSQCVGCCFTLPKICEIK